MGFHNRAANYPVMDKTDPILWTGWQRATRVPLNVVPPRNSPPGSGPIGATCNEPVSLLDLYPALIELCGLPAREGLSGRSLVPLLKNPRQTTKRVVLKTFDAGNHSVTGARWRYIRHADGSEELYDHGNDPNEWANLVGHARFAGTIAELAQWLPKVEAPLLAPKAKRPQGRQP